MARRKVIYVDGTTRKIVESPFSRNAGQVGSLFTGEKITLDVVPLKAITGGSNPSYEPDTSYASDTFKVGVGVPDYPSDSGDYKVTYNAATSAAISYDEDASGVQSALNAMATVISAGYVDVTGSLASGYRIRWRTAGAKLDFGSDEVNLLPESDVSFTIEKDGATGVKEVVIMRLLAKKAALTTTASSIPPGEMTVETKISGSVKVREVTQITCVPDTAPVAQREEFKCVAVGGVYETYSITTIADTALSLNGDYFVLPGKDGPVGFWFDLNAGATVPPAACVTASNRQVEVTTVVSGDGANTVAYKLAQVIEADVDFIVTDITANVILVKAANLDADGSVSAGTSGFTVTETVAGVQTDAYNGKYFYVRVRKSDGTSATRALYFSQDGTTDPPAAAIALDSDLIEISYSLDDTAQEMAVIITTALNTIDGISAVASGTEVHITQDLAGVVTDAAAGDSPLTNFSVTQNGADSTLDGTHFIMYETNEVGGQQSRAFWFNISGTAAPSGSALTADATTEITTVSSGALAHEVASAVASAVDALSTFSAYAKGAKVMAKASVGYNFTGSSSETSGFSITTDTSGGAGSDASAVVEVAFSDVAIGGVYVLGFNTGNGFQYSGAIPFLAPANAVTEIIEAMPMMRRGDVLVEGASGGNFRLSFRNNLANMAVTVTVDDSAIVWIQGFRFTLDLNTTSAHGLLYGKTELEGFLEVEASQGSDYTVKLVNERCIIYNGLIDPASSNPSPLLSYYTAAQVDNLIIHHKKTISSLTGGTSADLDSLATTGLSVPYGVFIWDGDNSRFAVYALVSGTDSESVPNVVRPDDFHSTTNPKVWKLAMVSGGDVSQYLLKDGSRAGTGMQELLGLNFTDATVKTLSSGAFTATQTIHAVAAESGTADNLDNITAASGAGDFLILIADAGDTVTVTHNVGNIKSFDGASITMTETNPVFLIRIGSTWLSVTNQAGGGGSMPMVDTTALVYDPVDNTKLVRLDAGAVATATTRAIQSPDGNSRVRDCLQFLVVASGTNLTTATFWLGHFPAAFKVESISGITYTSAGTLSNAAFDFKTNGSTGASVTCSTSNASGSGKRGSTAFSASLTAGDVLSVTITDTGAGSAGSAAQGLMVYAVGYWELI